jgi:hypothetical protein
MILIGVDYHPSVQQVAYVDTETGETCERRLTQRWRGRAFLSRPGTKTGQRTCEGLGVKFHGATRPKGTAALISLF